MPPSPQLKWNQYFHCHTVTALTDKNIVNSTEQEMKTSEPFCSHALNSQDNIHTCHDIPRVNLTDKAVGSVA